MNVLILGANADIAVALAHELARDETADVTLASRDMEMLEKRARDIEARYGTTARARRFDALDTPSHGAFYAALDPRPDLVVVAFGYLGDQETAQRDFAEARATIDANFTGAVSILEIAAADFATRGSGGIIGISSVAGERGRMSNYVYGAAKAGFTTYLAGLRNRLFASGVHVMTVLPGFVRTKMTDGLDLPSALTGTPEQVAADILRGWKRRRNRLYTLWFWRWIMLVIRSIPEPIFKRMKL